MKVLYFHQHFSTPQGSTGIRSYAMAQKLIKRGHSVTMVCGSYHGGHTGLTSSFKQGKRVGIVDGINIIEFNLTYSNQDGFLKRTKLFLLFSLRSIGVALTQKYDVVFATSTPLTAGIPGVFARWLRKKTFIFEVRDLWPELPKEMGVITNPIILKIMAILEWLSYKSAHRLIGLSPGIVNGITKLGVNPNSVAMIPNGCDLEIFKNKENSWRPKGVSDQDMMAIFTGTHGIANGLNAVLDAARVLKEHHRYDIKIVLIGQGREKKPLQQRAQKEDLNNVIFLDPVDKYQLSGLMASADLGLQILANVSAFYYGTSPNKFFDYIAAGLPVLNNYPGWLADIIQKEQCGFSIPAENPEAFAKALEDAADNRENLRFMGISARRLAENQFDRQKLSDEFVSWLEKEYEAHL